MSIFKARFHYIVDLEGCPRCGGDHPDTLFQALAMADQSKEIELYGYCSETNQPIVVKLSEMVNDPSGAAGAATPEELDAQADRLEASADALEGVPVLEKPASEAEVKEYGS